MSSPELEELLKERNQYARTVSTLTSRFDEKVEELSFVRMVGDALARCRSVEQICLAIVRLLQDTMAPENCSVFVIDDGDVILRSAMGAFDDEASYYEAALSQTSFKIGEGVVGHAAAQGQVIRIADAQLDERYAKRADGKVSPCSVLVVPLVFDTRVVGIINLSDSQADVFEAKHERLLVITANFAALAFENAALFEEVSESRALLQQENAALRERLSEQSSATNLIGESPKFAQVLQLMTKVANTSANVLITGESGTGKEVFARALHAESLRRDRPFIAVNCGALPESLLEAELFGIEKGVATGVDARGGMFEQANGGTLFLDEIGDMAPSVQVRLLRVLQEREVVRVGGSKVVNVDVRVIAATHRNLAQRIQDGHFRQDLFYRLKVVTLELPALRERPKDVLTLANHFVRKFAARHGRPVAKLTTKAARVLLTYDWPGNIRELEHLIEQAVILGEDDKLDVTDLGLDTKSGTGLILELPEQIDSLSDLRQQVEARIDREFVARALALSKNNKTKAAQLLGVSRRAFHYKLQKIEQDAN